MLSGRRDRGQAVPLVLAVVAVVALVMMGTARLALEVRAVEQAQIAADAAALAAVDGGRDAADRLATANGGRVVSLRTIGDRVEVVAMVHGHRATAIAGRAP